MDIRKATKSDADTVFALYRSAIGSEFSVWNEEYPGRFEIEQDLAADSLYVLTEGDAIIGAASVVPENELDDFSCWNCKDGLHKEIGRIVIAADHRGKGLAFVIVQGMVEILRQKGYRSVRLSVAKTNIPAYKTYIKAGFTPVGEAELYGGNYFLMEKKIEASKLLEISGTVELPANVSEEEFSEAFIGFMESNGWYFGGGWRDISSMTSDVSGTADRLARIAHMEDIYDRCREAMEGLLPAAERFAKLRPLMNELISYYESPLWQEDFDADRNGEIPENIKRGILTEDAIYDLITDEMRLRDLVGLVEKFR